MSQREQSILGYLKAILCCCMSGYEELHGIDQQAKQNYDEIKSNMDKFTRDWQLLHEETTTKLKTIVREYSPYIDEEVTGEQSQRVIERSKQLSVEFEELRKRHYALESTIKVDCDLAKARHQFFQTRLSRINVHGRNAAIAAAVLGAIVGAIVAWNIYRTTVPTVLGALIGLAAAILIAGVVFFIFLRVTKNAVERWGSLRTRDTEMVSLNVTIVQKASEVQQITDILKSVADDVMCASITLVEQANIYLTEK